MLAQEIFLSRLFLSSAGKHENVKPGYTVLNPGVFQNLGAFVLIRASLNSQL